MEPDTAEVTRWALSKAIMIGALVGSLLWTALIFRLPGLREFLFKKVGGFRWFGKFQMFKPMIFLFLAALTLGCTAANGSETSYPPSDPDVVMGEITVVAMGTDLIAILPWTPGTTDSITFIAERPLGSIVATASGTKPFTGVDTLFLGARPTTPGVTIAWDLRAVFWWTSLGEPTMGTDTIGTVSWTEPQAPGVRPQFGPPGIDSTGGSGSATGQGDPIGIFVLFTDAQVHAMDTLPSCKAAQVTACVADMRIVGAIDSAIAWPKWACGVYAGYDSTGWASFLSVAGPDSTWNTHSCDRELAALGYDSASVALQSVVDSLAAGVWLASVGPITRWFASRF